MEERLIFHSRFVDTIHYDSEGMAAGGTPYAGGWMFTHIWAEEESEKENVKTQMALSSSPFDSLQYLSLWDGVTHIHGYLTLILLEMSL